MENECSTSFDKNIILIGDTGSGKSTLANLLSKNTLVTYASEGHLNLNIKLKDPSNCTTPIGHVARTSETDEFIPIPLDSGEILWDCPGFEDRRGVLAELRNAFRMHKLIESAKHLKLVVTIEESSISATRAALLTNFFKRLNNTLCLGEDDSTSALKDCTTLIPTKLSDLIPNAIQNTLIDILEGSSAYDLVSSLAENGHIACFSTPGQYGLKTGEEISNKLADEIIDVISKSNYASKAESRVVVSDKTIIALEETVNESMALLNSTTDTITHAIVSGLENISAERLKNTLEYLDASSKITDLKALLKTARDKNDFLDLCALIYRLNGFAKLLNSIRHIEEQDEIFNEKIFMGKMISILHNICEMKEKDVLIQKYEKLDEIGGLWDSCKMLCKKFCRTFRFYRRCIKYGRKEALRREGIVSEKNKSIKNISEYYKQKEEEEEE